MALLGSNPHPKDFDMHAGMTSARRILAALMGAALAVNASTSSAADGAFYGLLRERDLTPFGFLRLDMRPAHAVSIEPGSWAIETELGYQNTWALSPAVEDYLISLEPSGRRELGPAEAQAIRDLPGENYLVDVETASLDVTLHYKLSPALDGLSDCERDLLPGRVPGLARSRAFTTRSASARSAGQPRRKTTST